MSDPRPSEVDPDGAGDEPIEQDLESAGRPATDAEEAGIVDQQAAVLKEMGEDPRDVDD
jgi:hypothetical protein